MIGKNNIQKDKPEDMVQRVKNNFKCFHELFFESCIISLEFHQ